MNSKNDSASQAGDSHDAILLELDGRGDTTVRPARPALRELMEKYRAIEAELNESEALGNDDP